jgi:uncharacterized protein (DUF1501 family)
MPTSLTLKMNPELRTALVERNNAMIEPNPFTRREFLYSGLAMMSTLGSTPAFLSSTGAAMADTKTRTSSKPGAPEDRILVVVQLSGGNDGLNTVVPYGADAYYKLRPNIGLKAKDIVPIADTRGIGLHTALKPVNELMQQDQAAIVQGVGYPNPTRSHFASMDVWHSGTTKDGDGEGWLGKAMDQYDDPEARGMGIVALDETAPLATQGETIQPVTFRHPRTLDWDPQKGDKAMRQAYDQLHQAEADQQAADAASFVYRTACDAQVASKRVRKAASRDAKTKFPNSGLGRQLQKVAAMIAEDLPTRVYYVAMGGFDTHANQGYQHQNLLSEFSTAMQAFQKELAATGDQPRVMTLAFSEFGRRAEQNASGGTDHGTAGPTFLFGDHVQPGLLGQHPSLNKLDHNDLVHTVDFRCIYASLLEQWLHLDSEKALGKKYRQARVLNEKLRT